MIDASAVRLLPYPKYINNIAASAFFGQRPVHNDEKPIAELIDW